MSVSLHLRVSRGAQRVWHLMQSPEVRNAFHLLSVNIVSCTDSPPLGDMLSSLIPPFCTLFCLACAKITACRLAALVAKFCPTQQEVSLYTECATIDQSTSQSTESWTRTLEQSLLKNDLPGCCSSSLSSTHLRPFRPPPIFCDR